VGDGGDKRGGCMRATMLRRIPSLFLNEFIWRMRYWHGVDRKAMLSHASHYQYLVKFISLLDSASKQKVQYMKHYIIQEGSK